MLEKPQGLTNRSSSPAKGTHPLRDSLISAVLIALAIASQSIFPVATPSQLPLLSGVGISILFLFGIKQIYTLFLTSFAVFWLYQANLSIHTLVYSGLNAFIIALQSAIIFIAYTQSQTSESFLGKSNRFLVFFSISTCVCCLSAGLFALNESAFLTHQQLEVSTLLSHFLANFTGIMVMTPLFATWQHRQEAIVAPNLKLELTAWVSLFVISVLAASLSPKYSAVMAIPLMIWAAARFPLFHCTIALCLCALVVVPTLAKFSDQPTNLINHWFVERQTFLAWLLLYMGSLYFNTLLNEKRRAESNLEELVQERTLALSQANQELKDEIFVREQAERSQRSASKRYRALIETAGIPIIVLDKNTCIKQWNRAAENTFGYPRDQIISKNFVDLFIPETHQDDIAWKLTRVIESGINQNNIESPVLSYEGLTQIMLWNINLLPSMNEDNEDAQLLLIGQNISDIRKTQDQLHYLAHFDSLTDCANRRLFEDRCAQAIQSAIRHRHNCALIGLDIDHFKRINDTLGHDAGDDFLVEMANRLKKCVRREDTIARLGGDEFAVLLANVNGLEGAETVARNMLEAITRPVQLKNNELVITCSVGITLCPDDGTHYPDLLKNSDMAMYRAKNAGRNNIQFYSPEMNEEMQRQLLIEQELRVALKEEQFELHYQPIVDIETGEVVALETLLRWQHPHRGLQKPEYFLQVAEQTGLLNDIGEWTLRKACEQGRLIQQYAGASIQIAFNLSARQYNHPTLLENLKTITQETKFAPQNLILEISEDTITSNSERSVTTLQALSHLGISITIDGFGTGLSSLRQIKQIPVDIIKIDRSFVQGIPEDEDDMAITETLLGIATHLDIRTFATGVETRRQEAFLKINGCRYAQGYLYSAPLPFPKLEQLFASIHSGEVLASGKQIFLPFNDNKQLH